MRYIYGNLGNNIELKEYLLKIDGSNCTYCVIELGADIEPTIDHVIPKSLGGSNEEFNLVLTCVNCNRNKGGKGGMRLVDFLLQHRRNRELKHVTHETIPKRVLEKLPKNIKEKYER